jgi:hypothetical protein
VQGVRGKARKNEKSITWREKIKTTRRKMI